MGICQLFDLALPLPWQQVDRPSMDRNSLRTPRQQVVIRVAKDVDRARQCLWLDQEPGILPDLMVFRFNPPTVTDHVRFLEQCQVDYRLQLPEQALQACG